MAAQDWLSTLDQQAISSVKSAAGTVCATSSHSNFIRSLLQQLNQVVMHA